MALGRVMEGDGRLIRYMILSTVIILKYLLGTTLVPWKFIKIRK